MTDVLLMAAAFIGVAAAAFLVARSPDFWFGLMLVVAKAVWPFIAKRKSPEAEAADREKWRQGIDPASTRRPGAGEH